MLFEGYKGGSEREGTVGNGRTKLYMSCREVFGTMPARKDFTPSFPCEVLQEGDETQRLVASGPRPAVTSILQS